MDNKFLNRLNDNNLPTLVFDGATGTSIQQLDLSANDFGGEKLEGCNEYLVLNNSQIISQIHNDFLTVGCDVIETNTFGASSIVLSEYGLENKAYEINKKAGLIARTQADLFSKSSHQRFVAGSIGPTTKLPTLGHIDFDSLKNSYVEQVYGLIDGKVDLFIVETCQDVLQIKTALQAIRFCLSERKINIPTMVSLTLETTGTMLIGSDIQAALTILEPFDIDILGLNCATGPEQMKEHIKYLSKNSPFHISCIPNAGLPENLNGRAHYKLTPIELKMQLMHFIEDLGVRVIGGCCGTTTDHIKSLVDLVSDISTNNINANNKVKQNKPEPSAASIYSSVPYYQDSSFLIIGERLNASGSKKVRELLNEEDWDGLISIAKTQVKENAHVLDVNVDYVGRDGVSDMKNVASRLVNNINLPLMLDSTEWQKMEAGLKIAGGKCLLNSTNYEDGEERFFKVLSLAKEFGSAVVVGTIDETGMARTAKHKLEIAKRAYKDALAYGIPAHEIFYDPLALPISTGIEEDRRNGIETIDAIKSIRDELPDVHILLGISNISFGLNPAARIVLNSIYLDTCCKFGLDSAILSPAKILPLSKIEKEHRKLCVDLINDNRKFKDGICTYDPLTSLTKAFTGVSTQDARSSSKSLKELAIEERLKQHIIDGERNDLSTSLDEALKSYKAIEIINIYLLSGMKVVGNLFASGEMQLPFVLQSAETMKAAVSYLEPFMETSDSVNSSKAKFLIATVKGDVHDIGKNLVDIILSNNGYEVINLGIKQDVKTIIEAQQRFKADCIAMSGLLVKSTAFMKDNLKAFNEANIKVPVILGGAALTPKFVNQDCSEVYNGIVIYGKDAFTDLRFMDAYVEAKKKNDWSNHKGFLKDIPPGLNLESKTVKYKVKDIKYSKSFNKKNSSIYKTIDNTRSKYLLEEDPIIPPFTGTKIIKPEQIPISSILKYLDRNALFLGQWQFKRNKSQSIEDFNKYINENAEPILSKLLDEISKNKLLQPAVSYGYFPCFRDENAITLLDNNKSDIVGKFIFPRQKSGKRLCISDYFCDKNNQNTVDYIPMQAVTMSKIASDYSNLLFKNDSYADYLFFHGLSVQLTEALAEYTHSVIRKECGFADSPEITNKEILTQKYRGCRFSFGYPACPNVSDSALQLKLLEAHKIGISIDEADQLHPEQSTTAIVSLHSEARYFSV